MRNTVTSFLNFSVVAFVIASAPTFAQTPANKPAKGDDKVDISDLENKYWAPKDTDFSVVQNRTYSKENRYFLSLEYGAPVNDAYSEGSLFSVTGNYFFTERYGVQLTYLHADLKNNQATNDLTNFGLTGVQPDHGRLSDYYGIGFNYVPFYAKMSFLGKKIIYFDMAVTPTLGMTKYTQLLRDSSLSKNALTYGFDITQYFFFTNYFAIRADLKNQWYSQDVLKYSNTGSAKQGDPAGTKFNHDILFLLGTTFYW